MGDFGRKFSLSWVRLASRKSIGDISACTACTQYKRIPKSQPVAEPTHIYVCMAFSLFHNYYYACGCVWVCVLVCVGVCALRLSCPNAPFNVISYGFVLTSALCSPAFPSAISLSFPLSLALYPCLGCCFSMHTKWAYQLCGRQGRRRGRSWTKVHFGSGTSCSIINIRLLKRM